MNLSHSSFQRSRGGLQAGFTLTELMTAMGIFLLTMAGVISSHIFGLRMYNLTASRLSTSYDTRAALSDIRDDIRSASIIYVGNGNSTRFTNSPPNSPQAGNALQICPTTDTNNYVRYYVDPADLALKRKSSDATNIVVIASGVTNQAVFLAEDYAGNVLTNGQNSRVIEMGLVFSQWELPVARAGAAATYSYYRVQTRTTRRSLW